MAHRLNSPGAVFRNFLEMAFGLMTVPTDPWKEIIKVRETLSPSAGPKSLDHEIQKWQVCYDFFKPILSKSF